MRLGHGLIASVVVAALAVGRLVAQAPNDGCATATPIAGAPVAGSNVGATTGPDPVPACAPMSGDVWFSWTAPCSGTWTASTCAAATTFGTVVAVWDASAACPGLVPVACSDVCASGPFAGSSATFVGVVGTSYRVSVGGNGGGAGTFELALTLGAAISIAFIGGGPGALGYYVVDGPVNGTVFVAMTLNAGVFPYGWFYGIDIGWLELIDQLSMGWPFLLPLQPCGIAQTGPFPGLPSGLQIYAVAIALPAGGTIPVAVSLPTVGVVP